MLAKEEKELRVTALQLAIESCVGTHPTPEYIVQTAQDFYKFLSEKKEES